MRISIVGRRIKLGWVRLRDWRRRTWNTIRPGPEASRGALWFIFATAAWAAIVGAVNLHSGFGLWIDFAFAFAVAALGIPLVALVLALLLTLLRKLPRMRSGMIIGACLFVSILWPAPLGPILGAIFGLMEGILGATVATFLFGHFQQAALSKKIITAVLCLIAVAANITLYIFLSRPGINHEELIRLKQSSAPLPPRLSASNPAERGPFAVRTLFYANGTDMRRPEYGKSAGLKTATVDASKFFKDFKGWKANLRRRYWGFGMDKLPLNARVWYPEGPGPFPLALIVHGNHGMAEFSDPGYAYLGELLASRGFIFASIDENFLNSGLFHDPPKQQAVRGWMLLEHLKLWHGWNAAPGNPFYRKIDLENVALLGHSRGGEAVATAALFNKLAYFPDDANIRFHYGFPIKSLVAIAPVDGQYRPAGEWRHLADVNYLTLQGSSDADVASFDGSRQWDHLRYTPHEPNAAAAGMFKAELYIYRANHGQFNTGWGRTDTGAPMNWFLNLKPLLSGDDQRKIGKVYISAFLEATLHNKREYLPLFRDHRAIRDWLPDTLYINRYLDSTARVITDFSEDPDVTTTTAGGGHISGENLSIWREGRIPNRRADRGYNGVFLGWNREHEPKATPPIATYSISLPDQGTRDWKPGPNSAVTLSLAVTEEKADPPGKNPNDKSKNDKKADKKKDSKREPEITDFTVELQATDGAVARLPLSQFGSLPPPFKVRFTKLEAIDNFAYQKASEPVFQTIDLPLGQFAQQNPKFDPAKLATIRLRFDRTETSVVILSEVAIEPDR